MTIRLERGELIQADGRTDRQTEKTKLIVAFRSFANVPTDVTSIEKIISQFNLMMEMFRKR
jgi:hypothetical protein